jgi:phytoene dehydrogenase-like protein
MADYDAIVVGAGHNGLAAAVILAKEGLKALVLEKNSYVGGMAATREFFKGFKHDVAASILFPLSERIVEDLELEKYGLQVIDTPILTSSTGVPGESPVIFYSDPVKLMEHIQRDHGGDAVQGLAGVFAFCNTAAEALDRFNPLSPPKSLGAVIDAAPTVQAKNALKKCFFGSVMDVINEFFPDPNRHKLIRSFLAFMAIQSTYRGPYTPGSALCLAYGLASPAMGQLMRRIKGGIGMLPEGLRRSFEEKGGEVRLSTRVRRILTENGKAVGVELRNNEKITAKVVLSNLDASATFMRLVGEDNLPADFVRMVKRIKCGAPFIQIHCTLKELPEFTGDLAFANKDNIRWLMCYNRGPEHYQQCMDDIKWGRIPEDPMFTYYISSVWDDSMAPPGYHSATFFSFYFPLIAAGAHHNQLKEEVADKMISQASKYAPNLRDAIMDRVVFTPLHFEKMFGITNGDYTHGLLIPGQMFDFRPVTGWSGYKTPVENLYLCGSACHPGPGVTAVPGYNSAHEVLKNWKK